MNTEETNIKIAELLGWTQISEHFDDGVMCGNPPGKTGTGYIQPIPRFASDLNLCSQFEAMLTDDEWDEYCNLLGGSLRACASATAPQRGDAFLAVKSAK